MNYLVGAGGHALVVLDICRLSGIPVHGVFTDGPANPRIRDMQIFLRDEKKIEADDAVLVAIGSNEARKRIVKDLACGFFTAIHPSAVIDASVNLGKGTVIMGGTVLNASATVGDHVIINTGSVVDHECVVEDFVHISPNATLCGNVQVGEGTHIGAGAVVIPNIRIGRGCVIGAGAVVIRDVPPQSMVVGNPARVIKQLNPF